MAYWIAETEAHAAGACNETADVDLTRLCSACPANA